MILNKLPEQLQFIIKKLLLYNDMACEEIEISHLIIINIFYTDGTIKYNFLGNRLGVTVLNFSEDEIRNLQQIGYILIYKKKDYNKLIINILEILNSAYEDKLNRKELIYFCTNKSIYIY